MTMTLFSRVAFGFFSTITVFDPTLVTLTLDDDELVEWWVTELEELE